MQNCTILIPTYNRSEFLKKLLYYIVNNKYNLPVFVVDGSTLDKEINNNKILIDKLNQEYNCFITHFLDESFIWNRINNITSKIQTKYCKLNNDDDFFSKEYIEEAVNFFEKNSNYSIVTGYSISFHQNKVNLENSKFFLGEKEVNLFEDPLKRFEFSIHNWHPFGVFKTKLFTNIFNEYSEIVKGIDTKTNFNQALLMRFFSYNMKLHSLIEGKVKFINRCMNLTIYHENNWGKQHGLINPLETFYSKDFLNSLVQLKESIVNRYNVNNDTINKFLHLVISNDKHIAKYSLQKKNFLEKIYNLSLKKLYENISLKIIKIFNIKKFILEDGQAIIQYIKKQK